MTPVQVFSTAAAVAALFCGCARVDVTHPSPSGDSGTPPPPPPPVAGSGPLVLYTDLISGPNSGGENNKGAYLSIFGKNFGSSGMGTTAKAFIGGARGGNYRYLAPSNGPPDIQER